MSGWAAADAGAPVDTTKDKAFPVAGGVSCDNSARVPFSGVCSRFRLVSRPVLVSLPSAKAPISLMRTVRQYSRKRAG